MVDEWAQDFQEWPTEEIVDNLERLNWKKVLTGYWVKKQSQMMASQRPGGDV